MRNMRRNSASVVSPQVNPGESPRYSDPAPREFHTLTRLDAILGFHLQDLPLPQQTRFDAGIMNFIRLYIRVLAVLGRKPGWAGCLAIANVLLAAAQFAEPVLFGRIIDALAGAQAKGGAAGLGRPDRRCSRPGSASACSPSSAARWSRCTPTGWRTAAATRC